MAKRRRSVDSDVSPTEAADYDTVFIDTSLGTHFVMLFSSSDTVSDFKKRLVVEHKRCFPKMGEITIRSLKVKRGENFYHLPDVLFVSTVFHRVEGDRFIAADCSSTPTSYLNQRSSDPGASDGVKIDLVSAICPVDGAPTPLLPWVDVATEKNVVSGMADGFNVEKSSKEVTEFKINSSLFDNSTESHERKKKKKRKLNHSEDVSRRSNVEEVVNVSHKSPVESAGFGNIMVNAVVARESEIGYGQQENLINKFSEVAAVRNDHSSNGVSFDGKTERKKMESAFPNDSVAGKSQDKYVSSIPTDHLEGVPIDEPIRSAGLVENTGMRQCMKSDGKKKGKKAKKTPAKLQDSSDLKVENRKAEGVEGSYIAGAAEKSEVGSIVDSPVLLHCDRREADAVLKNVTDEDDMSRKSGNELVPNDQADDCLKEFDLVELNNSVTLDDANVDGNRKREKAQADQDASTLEQEAATCESLQGTRDPATAEKCIEKSQKLLISDGRKPEPVNQKFEDELGKDVRTEHSEGIRESTISARVIDTSAGMQEGKSAVKKRRKSKKKDVETCATATAEKSIENFQLMFTSDERKEDTMLGNEKPEFVSQKSENEPCRDVLVEQDNTTGSNLPANVLDTGDKMGDAKSDGKKRKKSKKKGAKIQDALDVGDETRKGEFVEPCPEACNTEQKEVGSQPTLGPNVEGMRTPATAEKNFENSQIILASDGRKEDTVLESENPESFTRKSENDLDNIVPTEHSEGIRESDPSAGVVDTRDRMQDAKSDGKKRKKSKKKGPRIQDASCVEDKTRKGESNEPCAEACTTKEKKDGSRPPLGHNKEVGLPSYSKTSDCIDAEFSQKATGSLLNLPANNIVGEEKIFDSIRKRKKREDKDVSGVKSSLEKFSGEIPVTEQYLTSSVHIGRQQALAASSQVTPDKMEENVETEHGPTAEGINFRQYFVHGQNQQKGTSDDNVKVSSKSNGEMTTGKNVKESSLSSTNTEMKTPQAESLLGKLGTMKQDSSHVNSVNNKMTSMKPRQNKSILAKSGAKYQDNGRGNSIKKISMETPLKNNFLKKSVSIFQGNSDDDSGDETGAVHPGASTRAPSGGSSQSDDSEGESELSQRSHDGKGRSAGSVESTLDPDDFSIKMIVRSSKQFKKAKLQASQSEPELDESFLDTQPYP